MDHFVHVSRADVLGYAIVTCQNAQEGEVGRLPAMS